MKPANPNANIPQAFPHGRWTASGTREPEMSPPSSFCASLRPWRVVKGEFWEVWTRENTELGNRNNYAVAVGIQDEREARLLCEAPAMLKALRTAYKNLAKLNDSIAEESMAKIRYILARIEGKEQKP